MGFYERIDARGVRETGRPVSFVPKGALTHHLVVAKSASLRFRRWRKLRTLPCSSSPHKVYNFAGTPVRRWYCLRQPCALRGGCGSCGSLMSNATSHLCCCHWPRSRLYVLLHHQNCCFRFGNNPPPARIKLPPAALFAVMGIACRNTHFLFAKKKQKQGRKDGENEWRFTT